MALTNPTTIIAYSTPEDTECLSTENTQRIKIPVAYLKQFFKLIDSKSLPYDTDIAEHFIKSVYSTEYLNKISLNDKTQSQETLCDTCTFKNSIENLTCVMCGSSISSNYKTYLDEDNDTLFTTHTYDQIIESVKVLLDIIESYNKYHYYYALIRPPGHHSCQDHHEGFCVINNAYLLASNLTKTTRKNVLIFDWDLHHGNGTYNLIKSNGDTNIYFVSLHGYEHNFYPRTGSEESNDVRVLNVPLERNTTDTIYLDKFKEIVIPFISNILGDIDTIIISNGLDAHQDDPIHFMSLTETTYTEITKYFKSTGKKLIYLLEGGYNPQVIADISHKIIDELNT